MINAIVIFNYSFDSDMTCLTSGLAVSGPHSVVSFYDYIPYVFKNFKM